MAISILQDCKLYVDGFNVSGDSNMLTLKLSADEHDITTFNSTGWRASLAGLKSAELASEGFWYADGVDGPSEVFYSRLGGTASVLTVAPLTGAAGEVAWFLSGVEFDYEPFNDVVGEPATFVTNAKHSSGGVVQGTILVPQSTTLNSVTNTSSPVQLGAVAAGRSVYSAVHVLSVGGTSTPTINVKVQSGTTSGMGDATTRITHTGFTTIGGERKSTAGAITDTYWRTLINLTGTSPVFTAVVTVGIV